MRIKIFGINFYLKREVSILLIAIFALVFFLIIFTLNKDNNKIEIKTDGKTIELNSTTETEIKEISIYIIGCVKKSDIYILKDGDILNDLILVAGGFTENAAKENINLAYELKDNTMIKVLSKDEIKKEDEEKVEGISITTGLTENLQNTIQNGLININTCTIEDLVQLPGIAEIRAQKIIDYRNLVGKFNKIEDIMLVDDIKDSRYNDIKNLITVN